MTEPRSNANSASARLQKFQRIFPQAWLARDIYSGCDIIRVDFPPELDEFCDVHISMRHQSGRIYAEANTMLDEDTNSVVLRKTLNAPDGLYYALIRPKASEYYGATPYEVALPFRVINGNVSTRHYGDNSCRREEALSDASRRGPDVISELARLAWGMAIREAILVKASEGDEARRLLPLLFIIFKYGQQLPPGLAALLNGNLRRHEFNSGSPTPLTIVCRRLAALLYKRGDRAAAETRAWLTARAADGFDFFAPLADELMALTALVEFDDEFGELAAAVLDKLLFTLALHPTDFAMDVRLSPLSPVTRLLWGAGNWNPSNGAAVLLACAESYEIPSLIQAIAIKPKFSLCAIDQHRSGVSLSQRQLYRHGDSSLVSVGQRWLAELGHVRVFAESPGQLLKQQEDKLTCQGAQDIYFPTYAFDDWTIAENWAFARRAEGYLALHSESGFELLDKGLRRNRILRTGRADARLSLCLGSAEKDGDFESFMKRCSQPPSVDAPAISRRLHYSSPYCRADFKQPLMVIRYDDYAMQLDLSSEGETAT